MRKWRPTHKCIYIIPEVHGNMNSLEVIFNRILPLRKFKNQEDVLVMLGDYIDGTDNSFKVIETLMALKKEFNERVIFLRGNHEELMLKSIRGSDAHFKQWIDNGGISTIKSYLDHKNQSMSPYSIPRTRLIDIIPREHIDFISSMDYKYIIDDYVFFHGSFDHNKTINDNSVDNFLFDYTASKYVKDCLKNNQEPIFKDDYIFIGAHNFGGKIPFIHPRYLMLGGMAPQKLLVFELNSMSASMIKTGKSRIYKYNFKFFE